MSPRRPTPDPLEVARVLVEEADRARGGWRSAILGGARVHLDEARGALADGEDALRGQKTEIAELMRGRIEARRREIDNLAARIATLEASTGDA